MNIGINTNPEFKNISEMGATSEANAVPAGAMKINDTISKVSAENQSALTQDSSVNKPINMATAASNEDAMANLMAGKEKANHELRLINQKLIDLDAQLETQNARFAKDVLAFFSPGKSRSDVQLPKEKKIKEEIQTLKKQEVALKNELSAIDKNMNHLENPDKNKLTAFHNLSLASDMEIPPKSEADKLFESFLKGDAEQKEYLHGHSNVSLHKTQFAKYAEMQSIYQKSGISEESLLRTRELFAESGFVEILAKKNSGDQNWSANLTAEQKSLVDHVEELCNSLVEKGLSMDEITKLISGNKKD